MVDFLNSTNYFRSVHFLRQVGKGKRGLVPTFCYEGQGPGTFIRKNLNVLELCVQLNINVK
jgi:hypothetical protein